MTIKEFIDSLKALDKKFTTTDGQKFSETMTEITSIWNNASAKGYLIKAAQQLKMSRDKIDELLNAMEQTFSDLTVEEAEKIYINY